MQTVTSSSIINTSQGPVARIVIDTGKSGIAPLLCFFPLDTLEWRAAEWEIDLNDVDQLLEVILNESFLDESPDPYSAPTGVAGRAAHLTRIAGLKAAGRGIPLPQRGTDDPLQPVRDAHARLCDAEEFAAKKRYVTQHRAAVQARRHRPDAATTRRPLGNIYHQPQPKEAPSA